MPRSTRSREQEALHSKLTACAGRDKRASLGGEPEQAFEQSFASLAYSYIRDQAPRLIDYLVGFQLVERNNDNTKAVGVFGFKLGDVWAYAPVFFLNGDLKGHELLYLKNQDMFVPLTESWVNYVVSKRPHVLGKPTSNKLQELGVRYPDYRTMSTPPLFGKRSEYVYPSVPAMGWVPATDGFKGVYGAFAQDDFDDAASAVLAKHANSRAENVLLDFISRRPEWCKLAMDVCDAYPRVGDAMRQFHGETVFHQALRQMRQAVEKAAALTPAMEETIYKHHFTERPPARKRAKKLLQSSEPKAASALLTGKMKRAAGPSVEIIVRQDSLTTENGPDLAALSDEEAAGVARNGYLVRDHRTGEEVSVAYNTQVQLSLTNPDVSGLYEVLEKPSTFVKTLIICDPHSTDGRKDFAVAVRLDPRNWINAHPTSLFAKPNVGSTEEFRKWYDGLSGSESLAEGGVYVIISPEGAGTVPFEVEESLGEGRYRIWPKDYASRDRPSYLPSILANRDVRSYDDDQQGPNLLWLNDRAGVTFRSSQKTLQVPKEHKILRLKAPRQDNDDCCLGDSQSTTPPFRPGNMLDLQMEIMQKTATLKLYADSCEASINGGPRQTKLATLQSLILQHGLRVNDAKAAIKQAEVAGARGECGRIQICYGPDYPRTKEAVDPFLAGQGAQAPAIMDPNYSGGNEWGSQYPTQDTDQYSMPVEELSSYQTDPETYDPSPEAMPDPYAMQSAQQAGQSGQKEVFDTAMISNLLKNVRQDPMISRYTPDLLKAMDRVGRILALMYWHNDQFADRFGKSDLPELEDSLRNTFDSIGELVLFLKARDVAPLAGGVESDIDVDQATGD